MKSRFRHFMQLIRTISFFVLISLVSGCKDFVEIPMPETELPKESVFQDDATAQAAVNSIYIQLSSYSSFANGNLSVIMGAYADELISYSSPTSTSSIPPFFFNNVVPANNIVSSTWGSCYNLIYSSNLIIEGLQASTTTSPAVRNQLLGEAYFIRAFCHFYLAGLYGKVPLVLTSDYRTNAVAGRSEVNDVYLQVIKDLLSAKEILLDRYPSTDRVRVNRGAATALLSRAYLYAGDNANAELQATEIVNNTDQYKLLPNLNEVFLKTSQEAIWQLLPNGGLDGSTNEASFFILLAPPSYVALRDDLVNAFDANDLRKTNWIKSLSSESGFTKWYYAFKYKENNLNRTGAEYSMVLRLGEQYLIRAEARARQDKLTGDNSAGSDLNAIRIRAGLAPTTATAKEEMLTAIERERRLELFTEWGHRFFDLKRAGKATQVLKPVKPNWDDTDVLLPIPQSEILINTNLQPQNPGY